MIEGSINPSLFTKPASFEEPVSRPDVATVLHFAVLVYVDAQLQVGGAAVRGQRREAVIRDTSGVGHPSETNLSAGEYEGWPGYDSRVH